MSTYERRGVLTSIALATSRRRGFVLVFENAADFRAFDIGSHIANQQVIILEISPVDLDDRAGAQRSGRGTIRIRGEHRRNQHSAGFRPGFREFSLRREREKRSRRSLSIAARRGGGPDCARSRRAGLTGGQGSSRGGASGRPSSWSNALDAVRTRHACSAAGKGYAVPSVLVLFRLDVAQFDKDDFLGAFLPDQVEIDMDVVGEWLAAQGPDDTGAADAPLIAASMDGDVPMMRTRWPRRSQFAALAVMAARSSGVSFSRVERAHGVCGSAASWLACSSGVRS